MIRRPPRSTRTDTLFPYTTLFRSKHLHLYFLPFGEDFGNLGDALVLDLGDVDEAVTRTHEVHECAEIDHRHDLARVYRAHLRLGRSEERREGQECVSTCRSRWSPSQ